MTSCAVKTRSEKHKVPGDSRSTKFQGFKMACRVEVGSTCSSPSPKPTSDFQERVDCTTLDSLKSQPGS